jgi:CheY-like chemotaxis protein
MKTSGALTYAASIVVVEDSDEDFDTLRDAAATAGVTRVIHRVASGGDCLALLRGGGHLQLPLLPALIVMDLNSHGVDGREALVGIKSDASLKEIPLVVLTTSANPKDVAFCYQAGANAYHVKPVRHDQYLLLLRTLLQYWLESVTLHAVMVKVD